MLLQGNHQTCNSIKDFRGSRDEEQK